MTGMVGVESAVQAPEKAVRQIENDHASSNLVEGGDVDGLDLLVESLDGLLEVVSGDLQVLDDATDEDLLNTEGDGDLLVLGLPEEAVHLDGEDLLGELVKVGLSLVGLHLEEDEGLGDNDAGLLGGCVLGILSSLLLGGKSSSGFLNY